MTAVVYQVKVGAMNGSASRTRLTVGQTASSPERLRRRRRVPASIPRSQAYYWKHAWQNGEQETLRELAAGEGIRFTGARDAIRWLLSADPPNQQDTTNEHRLTEGKFRERVNAWRMATGQQFIMEKILYHPTYLAIIGLGPDAVQFLLRELRDRPSPLFLALTSITGANPIQPGSKMKDAIKDWLQWGRENGIDV
jgi:hypothetical protein